MAGARMLDVPRRKWPGGAGGGTMRLNFQSQLCRSAGTRGANAPHKSSNGRRRRNCRTYYRLSVSVGCRMPRPFISVTSIPAPLMRDNVDTDVIIRVDRLFGAVPREELGLFAFEALRCRADGTRDPDFPLNNEVYEGA